MKFIQIFPMPPNAPSSTPNAQPRGLQDIRNDLDTLRQSLSQINSATDKEAANRRKKELYEELQRAQVSSTEQAEKAAIEQELAKIEAQLNAPAQPNTQPTSPIQQPQSTPTQKPSFAEGIGSAMEKVGKMLEKVRENIAKMFGKMSTNALKGLHSLVGLLGMKKMAERLHEYIEPSELRDMMQKKLQKPVEATADDADTVKELHEQHLRVVQSSNGTLTPENFTFSTFIQQRVEKIRPDAKETFTLADLLEAGSRTDSASVAADSEKEEERQTTVRQTQEALEENPEVMNAAHVFALARALNKMEPNTIRIDGEKMRADVRGEAGKSGYYESVAQGMQEWLSAGAGLVRGSNYPSGDILGIALDGTTIESENNNNWVYDPNLIEGFDLTKYPKSSVEKLITLSAETLASANETAQKRVPQLQQFLKEELGDILGSQYTEQSQPATTPAPEAALPDAGAAESTTA